MKKSKKGVSKFTFFFVIIPLSVLLSLLIVSAIVGFFVFKGYGEWEKGFESEHMSYDYLEASDALKESSVKSKIQVFANSSSDVDSVTFTPQESLFLVMQALNQSFPDYIRVEKGLVKPADNEWTFYLNLKIKNTFTPWVILTINKVEGEGSDIFVQDISVGDYSVKEFGFTSYISKINDGIRDALFLVNQKDFSGRRILNIELDSSEIVIKGKR